MRNKCGFYCVFASSTASLFSLDHLQIFFSTEAEIGWDLEAGTLCCSACTLINISLGNKMQINYKGLTKTTNKWHKLCITMYKKTKIPTATSKKQRAKTIFWEQKRDIAHLRYTQYHQRANHLSQHFSLIPGHTYPHTI